MWSLPQGYCHYLFLSVCVFVCVCVHISPDIVCSITHHPFKLGSPNLDQRYKTPLLRPLLFWGQLTLILKVKSNLKVKKSKNFIMTGFTTRANTQPLEKIHDSNDYLDWFMAWTVSWSPSAALLYLYHVNVPAVSQCQPSASILI